MAEDNAPKPWWKPDLGTVLLLVGWLVSVVGLATTLQAGQTSNAHDIAALQTENSEFRNKISTMAEKMGRVDERVGMMYDRVMRGKGL